jgi:phosphoglycolate phosphatase-like HAD superfamily hydrolase
LLDLLGDPPPEVFVDELRRRGVDPLSVGHVIVATREPHRATVLDALRSLGLDRDLISNKGAVMLLPPGIDKAAGLEAAVARLALSLSDVVGIGDAENDLAFLRVCGYAVAVANALAAVRDEADFVTRGEDGEGVVEFVELMMP